jgi:hypothetical protein
MTTPDSPPPLVWVYLSNGTGTSGGNGPGPVQVPPDEAAFFVGERLAVYGSIPPTGYAGNGVTISPSTGRGYTAFGG